MTNDDKKIYLDLYASAKRIINRNLLYIEEIERIEKHFIKSRCDEEEERQLKLFKKSVTDRIQEQEKVWHLVEQSINNLTENRYREILQYRYMDGLTWDEIADKMMYSLCSIHRLHNKALEQLL